MINLSIVIPVYNEEKSIKEVIADIQSKISRKDYNYEIIVVNDGSTDNTRKVLESIDAKVINHPVNQGYGTALIDGIKEAKHDYVVTIDADGSYPVDEILKLSEYAFTFDLVVGQRTGKEYWGTLLKYPARLFFKWLAEFTTGVKILDVNSGLRILNRKSFDKISLPVLCRGFSFSTTMTLSFILSGMTLKYVPIKYLPRVGHSKVRYIRDTLRTLQALTEVIVYYNPLKIVLLICVFPFLVGLLQLLAYFAVHNNLWLFGSIMSFYFACLFFILGLFLDLIRMNRNK